MKENYFVGSLGENPEIQAVYWCKSYKEALEVAHDRIKQFPGEEVIIARLMPLSNVDEKLGAKP